MAPEYPQGLGQSENELAMGDGKEQLLIEILCEEESSFLAARRAEEEALAGKGAEVLVAAFGIHTSDAGHTLAVVAAGEEAGRHSGDALDAEVSQSLGT